METTRNATRNDLETCVDRESASTWAFVVWNLITGEAIAMGETSDEDSAWMAAHNATEFYCEA